jgi:hypothetical protein
VNLALHEIETSEGDDGTMSPVEQFWTPAEGATENGCIAHHDLHVAAGLDDPPGHHYPVAFLGLGYQRWTDIIEAAAAYMSSPGCWNFDLSPVDAPA